MPIVIPHASTMPLLGLYANAGLFRQQALAQELEQQRQAALAQQQMDERRQALAEQQAAAQQANATEQLRLQAAGQAGRGGGGGGLMQRAGQGNPQMQFKQQQQQDLNVWRENQAARDVAKEIGRDERVAKAAVDRIAQIDEMGKQRRLTADEEGQRRVLLEGIRQAGRQGLLAQQQGGQAQMQANQQGFVAGENQKNRDASIARTQKVIDAAGERAKNANALRQKLFEAGQARVTSEEDRRVQIDALKGERGGIEKELGNVQSEINSYVHGMRNPPQGLIDQKNELLVERDALTGSIQTIAVRPCAGAQRSSRAGMRILGRMSRFQTRTSRDGDNRRRSPQRPPSGCRAETSGSAARATTPTACPSTSRRSDPWPNCSRSTRCSLGRRRRHWAAWSRMRRRSSRWNRSCPGRRRSSSAAAGRLCPASRTKRRCRRRGRPMRTWIP